MKTKACKYCETVSKGSENHRYIFENELWVVLLSQNQNYLGHCEAISKNHVESVGDLSEEDWIYLGKATRKLVYATGKAFNPANHDMAQFCNKPDARTDGTINHVHQLYWPRYSKDVMFDGILFRDPYSQLNLKRSEGVCREVSDKIIVAIQTNMEELPQKEISDKHIAQLEEVLTVPLERQLTMFSRL